MINDLLKATGLNHEQLAELLGISVRTLGLWKKNQDKINEPAKKLIRHCLKRYHSLYKLYSNYPEQQLVAYINSL